MAPVVLCLAGTGMRLADKLFIAWFGPRGLATIVFAIIIVNEKLPGNDTIVAVAGGTVLLSVLAHGVSANPLVKVITRRSTETPAGVNRTKH
jgi:NhaP-type Na+/H+ or K+/H+ antiporter